MQHNLGGRSTTTTEQDAELDYATPHIQLTSDLNKLHDQQDDNNDEILGD